MSSWRFLVLPAILLALLGLQVKRGTELIRASRLLWAVEARTLSMIRGRTLQPAHVTAHLTALADAAGLDPAEVGIQVAIGSQYFLRGDFEKALATYREARRLEARPEILLNMGKANQMLGRKNAARFLYGRAVRLDPALLREVPAEMQAAVSEALGSENDPDGAQQDGQIDPD
ncbi:MAG: hypothetical protein AB7G12_14205 [Thermoanaerobaculia bacterium]